MSSDSVQGAELGMRSSGDVARLLDPAFGFFVWAGHLVVIYIANAVTCALGLTSRYPSARSALVIALAAFTVVTAAVVGVHGLKRFRQRYGQRAPSAELKLRATDVRSATAGGGFLLEVAVGSDAIAALAILWQLIPIFMTPVCR